MQNGVNKLLQITDLLTTRRFAVRIGDEHDGLPLEQLLDRYVKAPPLGQLQAERRITDESTEMLESVQDFVYMTSDDGRLHGMFTGLEFSQGPHVLGLDEVPRVVPIRVGDKDALLIDVELDRTNVGYDRNWVGFNRRRWDRHPEIYEGFVRSCLEEALGQSRAETVLGLETADSALKLVEVLARRIWESDFENYSRFVGRKLVYKFGDETVRNVIEGSGGICSEKVQALKFLTDHYGVVSEYIMSGPDTLGPVPEAKLRELLTTFDFSFSKRYMRYWQHTALRYTVNGTTVLVDDTNGNIPFLFAKDAEAERLLGYDPKEPLKVRMAVDEEDFYYHPVSQDLMGDLLFAMEGWIPYIDLVQVFDNELGLCITEDFMVTAAVYKSEAGLKRLDREYTEACRAAGLQCSVTEDWTLDSPLGQQFTETRPDVAEKVRGARDHLLARYNECFGGDHNAGLVVIDLEQRGGKRLSPVATGAKAG